MPLRLQRRRWVKADGTETESWRLIVLEYDRTGKATSFYPERKHYQKYGLDPDDPYEVAFEKFKSVQAAEKLKRTLVKRAKVEHRLKREDMVEIAFLPREIWERFLNFYMGRRGWDEMPPKFDSHLRAFRKMVKAINLEPSLWPEQPGKIYRYFEKNSLSFSYFKKLYPIINAYGYFYSKELNRPFLSVPSPSDEMIERMNDANLDSRNGQTKESRPLTPELLASLSGLKPDQFQWVRYSLYFGLRPNEVDLLTPENKGPRWTLEPDARGTPILGIYQAKLVSLPRPRRWKYIPCILPEQRELATDILAGVPIKRPYPRFIQERIGEGFTLYAGRKGFDALMRAHGQARENIMRWEGRRDFRELEAAAEADRDDETPSNKNVSRWLGHSSMRRTDTNYREIGAVEYDRVERKKK